MKNQMGRETKELVSEVEASIQLEVANRSDPEGFKARIIKDWFRYRRKLGIESYGIE